jgi:hypothetical protein
MMKQYSSRYVQLNLAKLLEELPFQITRYGKVVGVVNRYNVTTQPLSIPNVTTHTSATKPLENVTTQWEEVELHKCDMVGCKKTASGKFVLKGNDWEKGETTAEKYLCNYHLTRAKKEGAI